MLPPPYNQLEAGEGCVDLLKCQDMVELNRGMKSWASVMPQIQGDELTLSVRKYSERVSADVDAIHLSRESLRQLAACGTGLDYCYDASSFRESRFQLVMSFFLLTFPRGGTDFIVPEDVPWLFHDYYRNNRFVITPDLDALSDFIQHLASHKHHISELCIDYFSVGSHVIWYLDSAEMLSPLSKIGCSLRLRIHPAMLLAPQDFLYPLFRYLMRSSVWRSILTPPDTIDA